MTNRSSPRARRIETTLAEALAPLHLDVRDESHLHAGHAGARDGRGHFRVVVVSEKFADRSRVQRHRLCYSALGDQMQTDIHALAIEAFSPEEWERAQE